MLEDLTDLNQKLHQQIGTIHSMKKYPYFDYGLGVLIEKEEDIINEINNLKKRGINVEKIKPKIKKKYECIEKDSEFFGPTTLDCLSDLPWKVPYYADIPISMPCMRG